MPDLFPLARAPPIPPDRLKLDRDKALHEALDSLLRLCALSGGEGQVSYADAEFLQLLRYYVKKILWLICGVPEHSFLSDHCESAYAVLFALQHAESKILSPKRKSRKVCDKLKNLCIEVEELVDDYRRLKRDPEYEGTAFPDPKAVKTMLRLRRTLDKELVDYVDLTKAQTPNTIPPPQPKTEAEPSHSVPVPAEKTMARSLHMLTAASPKTSEAAHRLFDVLIGTPIVPQRPTHRPRINQQKAAATPEASSKSLKTGASEPSLRSLSQLMEPIASSSRSGCSSVSGSTDSTVSYSKPPGTPRLQSQELDLLSSVSQRAPSVPSESQRRAEIVALPLSEAHIRPEYIDIAIDSAVNSARSANRRFSLPESALQRPESIDICSPEEFIAKAYTPTRGVGEKLAGMVSATQQRTKSAFALIGAKLSFSAKTPKCDSEGDELPPPLTSEFELNDDDSFIDAYREFMQDRGRSSYFGS